MGQQKKQHIEEIIKETMFEGKVKYWDLGRNKAKGEFEVHLANEKIINEKLRYEFGKHLVSSGVSWKDGIIYAGFRAVGKFKFIPKE